MWRAFTESAILQQISLEQKVFLTLVESITLNLNHTLVDSVYFILHVASCSPSVLRWGGEQRVYDLFRFWEIHRLCSETMPQNNEALGEFTLGSMRVRAFRLRHYSFIKTILSRSIQTAAQLNPWQICCVCVNLRNNTNTIQPCSFKSYRCIM